jgi:chromate transport protein ChrA
MFIRPQDFSYVGVFELWDFLKTLLLGFVLVLPAWLLMLPLILRFDSFGLPRFIAFLMSGAATVTAVILGETYYFFTVSRSNAMPPPTFFTHEALWFACGSVAVCLTYAWIVDTNTKRPSSEEA